MRSYKDDLFRLSSMRKFRFRTVITEKQCKKFRYIPMEQIEKRCAEHMMGKRLNRSIKECVVGVNCVNNIVLVETIPRLANAAGAYIDNIRSENMLVCVGCFGKHKRCINLCDCLPKM